MKKISLTLLLSLLASLMWAADNNYVLRQLPRNNLNNSITAMEQDEYGFVWLGTVQGLFRYDAYTYKSFNKPPYDTLPIAQNIIRAIYKDDRGRLWSGTDIGASVYDVSKASFINLYGGIEECAVNTFCSIADGRVVVGTSKGVAVIDPETHIVSSIEGAQGIKDNIFHSALDLQGRLWLAGLNGFYRLRFANGILIEVKSWPKARQLGFFAIDSFNKIWFSDGGEIHRMPVSDSPQQSAATRVGINAESKKILFADSMVYIATYYKGLQCVRLDNRGDIVGSEVVWIDSQLKNSISNSITTLMRDRKGVIWIGTVDGVFLLSPKVQSQFKVINSSNSKLTHNVVSDVLCDNSGAVWASTSDGLSCIAFYGSEARVTPYRIAAAGGNLIMDNRMQAAVADNDGVIRIGTKRDIVHFDPIKGRFVPNASVADFLRRHDANFVKSMYKESNGDIWMGMLYGGLVRWNYADGKCYMVRLLGRNIHTSSVLAIERDKNSRLWVGTKFDGVLRIEADELNNYHGEELSVKRYRQYSKHNRVDGLSSNIINVIFARSNGELFVGTREGFYLYDSLSDSFKRQRLNMLNRADYITTVIEDMSGKMWVFTTSGVYRWVDQQQLPAYFELYKGSFARIDYMLSGCMDKRGRIFVGGINGVTYFDPDQVHADTTDNSVYFSDLSILNNEVLPDSNKLSGGLNDNASIVLSHSDNQISFEFSSLDYDSPQDIRYCYRLEGFDVNWVYISGNRNYISYSNLPEGSYKLRVRATNKAGMWSSFTRDIDIKVLPPWWATWWSYCLYVFVVASVVFVVAYIFRARYRYRQNERLNQWKQSFYVNVTHGFKTPLTLMQIPIDTLMAEDGNLSEQQRQSMLKILNKNVGRLTYLIGQLLEFRRIDSNKATMSLVRTDIMPFVVAICKTFDSLYASKGISLTVETSEPTEVVMDPEKIETVMYNLLLNGCTFTPAGGSVVVRCFVNKQSNMISVSVEDNGIGVPKENHQRIFERFWRAKSDGVLIPEGAGIGLALSKDMVELHGGTIGVASEPGKGSQFTFSLPLGSRHFKGYHIELVEHSEELLEPVLARRVASMEQEVVMITSEIETIRQERILIFSTDNDMINILRYIFKEYRVESCADLVSVNKAIVENHPQLIIADTIASNKMLGVEVARGLKENKSTIHIPIILLTAEDTREDAALFYNIGIDSFMEKPFEAMHLRARAKQLMQSRVNIKEGLRIDMILSSKAQPDESVDDKFLQMAAHIIEDNISNEEFDLNDFATQMMMSRTALHSKMRAMTNKSPIELLRYARMQRAAQLLFTNAYNITQVGYMTGFSDSRYFSTCFKRQFGVSPREYVERETGKDI